MVNDMLALWLGLAQAPEPLKYLQDLQNKRLILFKWAGAGRERERKPGHFSTSSLHWGNSTRSSNGQHRMNNVHVWLFCFTYSFLPQQNSGAVCLLQFVYRQRFKESGGSAETNLFVLVCFCSALSDHLFFSSLLLWSHMHTKELYL